MSDTPYLDNIVARYLTAPHRLFLTQSGNVNSGMVVDSDGQELVELFEGCEAAVGDGTFTTYFDSVGVMTIGYGHTNLGNIPPHIVQGDVWSPQDCDNALANDMTEFEINVTTLFPDTKLNQNQFDALVSFDFNTGDLARSSIPPKIIAGNLSAAMATLLLYNHAGGQVLAGLTRRRRAEMLLFNGDVQSALILAGAQEEIERPRMAKATTASGNPE